MTHSLKACAGIFLLLACPAFAAETQPLWEAGLGAAALDFPKYRGSNERTARLLPFPYLVYRGKVLRFDERRMRGLVFESDRVELDLGFNGTLPVKSSDTAVRRGMPDLDATLEIGPSLNVKLAGGHGAPSSLELRLSARAVIASDFSHATRQGTVFQPTLAYDLRDPFGLIGWKFGLLGGPLAGDRAYHRYFYGVDSGYATAQRPAYDARGGYAGTQLTAALSKRYPKFWVGGFTRWDRVDGAVFADSPLVQSRNGLSVGVALAWMLGESSQRVEREE